MYTIGGRVRGQRRRHRRARDRPIRERAHRHPCVEKGIHTKERDRNQAVPVTKSIISSESRLGVDGSRRSWLKVSPRDSSQPSHKTMAWQAPMLGLIRFFCNRSVGSAVNSQQRRNHAPQTYKNMKQTLTVIAAIALGAFGLAQAQPPGGQHGGWHMNPLEEMSSTL